MHRVMPVKNNFINNCWVKNRFYAARYPARGGCQKEDIVEDEIAMEYGSKLNVAVSSGSMNWNGLVIMMEQAQAGQLDNGEQALSWLSSCEVVISFLQSSNSQQGTNVATAVMRKMRTPKNFMGSKII